MYQGVMEAPRIALFSSLQTIFIIINQSIYFISTGRVKTIRSYLPHNQCNTKYKSLKYLQRTLNIKCRKSYTNSNNNTHHTSKKNNTNTYITIGVPIVIIIHIHYYGVFGSHISVNMWISHSISHTHTHTYTLF